MSSHVPQETVVTIDVLDGEPDVLQKISALNGAFFRVIMGGARLIEVYNVDYVGGHMEALVMPTKSLPSIAGSVLVKYTPKEACSEKVSNHRDGSDAHPHGMRRQPPQD